MLKSLLTTWSTSLRIGLSKNGMTLLRLSGWRQRQLQMLADDTLSYEESLTPKQIATQLSQFIKESNCEGLPAQVIIADEWVRIFIVTPPKNCNRIEDCRAAANMRFQSLYGEGVGDWNIEADWDPRLPFLACAIPLSLHSALLQVAKEQHLTFTSILPHFIVTWNRWHRQLTSTGWFGMVHDNILTLGIIDQQRLCAVRTVLLPEHAWNDPQWLTDYVLREALRLNVSAVTSLQLCGTIPGQWLTITIGNLHCMRLDSDHQGASQLGHTTSLILANSGQQQ